MTKAEYLYGDLDLGVLEETSYKTALITKILAAKDLMVKLVQVDDMADHHRMAKVSKAITFNKNLLKELGYDEPAISKLLKENK